MQIRKILAYFWICPAMICVALPGADLPVLAGSSPRAKVVIVGNPQAATAFQPRPDIVQEMVDHGILNLTGKPDLKQAWLSVVSPKDIVGIKVYSEPGANSGTRPAVAGAVVVGLLQAGLPPSHIIIWDKRLLDLRLAGYDDLAQQYKICLAGAADSGYDEDVSYDNPMLGTLVAGDLDFDLHGNKTGRKSYLTKLVTQRITKIINISPLLNHNMAGTCGNLYSLAMGSVDNTLRFEVNAHQLANAVPEIFAQSSLSDHVALNITDALIGQYQGEQTSLLHYSVELNQIWLSKDPVALDVLAIKELDRERQLRNVQTADDNPELYKNASYYLELGVDDPAKMRIQTVK